MQGIFDRADELTQELIREYDACAQQGMVSERAKNLFHEVMVKIMSSLDFAMNRIFDKYTSHADEKKTRIGKNVYFTIFDDESEFKEKIDKYGLSPLAQSNPKLYAKLWQSQPFSTGRKDFLWLKELSNLGKHVRLARHECQLQEGKQVTLSDGSMHVYVGKGTNRYDRNGNLVDPSTYGIVQDILWPNIEVYCKSGTITMPHLWCLSLCKVIRCYIEEVLPLI